MRSQFCYWLLPSGAKSYCGLIIPTIATISVRITLKANSSGSQHHRGQMSRKAEFVDKYSWLSHYPQYLPSTFEAAQSSISLWPENGLTCFVFPHFFGERTFSSESPTSGPKNSWRNVLVVLESLNKDLGSKDRGRSHLQQNTFSTVALIQIDKELRHIRYRKEMGGLPENGIGTPFTLEAELNKLWELTRHSIDFVI